MPNEQTFAASRPGTGDVRDGSVDYYPMDWEIVGRDSLLAARGPSAGRARQADDAAPEARDAEPRCGSNRPRQTDDAGGYEMVNE